MPNSAVQEQVGLIGTGVAHVSSGDVLITVCDHDSDISRTLNHVSNVQWMHVLATV